jgi:hypothetical protein
VSDKFRTHTKQEQYYSHLFQFCLYIYAKWQNILDQNDANTPHI